jgi:hypothetical protein
MAVGDAVGVALGDAVGLGVAESDAVGLAVAVGDAVGVALGDAVGLGVAESDAVGLAVAVGDAVGALGVGESVGAAAAHVDRVIVSSIRVTSPLRASARPFIVTPLFIVMEVRARIVPAKIEPDPSVAELVTCQ